MKREKKYRRAHIEITNACNLKCSFCPEVERGKKVMDANDFRLVVQRVKPYVEEIGLHLMGEPLGHPDFEQIIKICEENEVRVNLTTNAMLLTGSRANAVLSPVVRQVNLSVHSFEANFGTKGLGNYMERVFAFVRRALEERKDLYINLRVWDRSEADRMGPSQLIEHVEREFGITVVRDSIDIRKNKDFKLKQRVYLNFDSRFEWPSMDLPHRSKTGFCYGLIDHFGIHADGTVVPCCLDKEAVMGLGNIFADPVESMLESPTARQMRDGFLKGQLTQPMCQRCPFIARFDGKAARLGAQVSKVTSSTVAAVNETLS